MKAIIETGGKQYTVTEGTEIYVEKVTGEAGDTVTFDKVLMLDGKVVIFKYNAKKNYHKTQGHRQPYTKIVIKSIK